MRWPAKPEKDCPCWRLKLIQMGTYRVQMKGVLPRLVCYFFPVLVALVSPVQNIFFPHRTQLMCPPRPATWAGSRLWPPGLRARDTY
jgi:hypothetical protein